MKIVSSTIDYECPILRVEKREVLVGPNDDIPETHYTVVRPPNVCVIGLTDDKKIVLLKETIGKRGNTFNSLPSGKMHSYEPSLDELLAEARVELHDEGGYEAGNIELLQEREVEYGYFERMYYHFVAWDLTHVGQQLEPAEQISVNLVTLDEAEELLKNNDIGSENEHACLKKGIEFFRGKGLL